MTPFEHQWGVVGGGPIRVFDTRLGRIGVAICYDAEFPLLVRAQAEAGADIVLVPSCTERVSGFHRVRTAALARALENTIATVMSPLIGDAPWSPAVDRNRGAGGIFVPAEAGLSDTGVVAEGRPDVPGWVCADIDLAQLRGLRGAGEMRNFTDWSCQPGARANSVPAEIVTLP
jgi:predicted amidohydrolase